MIRAKLCDNCKTCNPRKRKLIAAYAPVTIPILIGAELRDRIYQLIKRICTKPGPADPDLPGSGGSGSAMGGTASPGTAATLDAFITRSRSAAAATADRLSAMSSAGAGSAAADPVVGRLQSLVRNASQSRRLPRRLRRALPRDPGRGTSVAIVTGAIAAAIVIIAILVAAASTLTSGNPAPQTGEGGTAVAQGAQPSSPAPASYNPTITGPTYVDSIPTTMIDSHLIDVNLVKIIDPARETNVGDVVAGNGNRLVALVFQLKCISGSEYGETKVQISTSDGQQYSPVIAGIVGYSNAAGDGTFSISAGQTESIVIPYLIPDGVTITAVEWKPYLYARSDLTTHGDWTVRE
jgi:hypothetical protein